VPIEVLEKLISNKMLVDTIEDTAIYKDYVVKIIYNAPKRSP